MPSASMRALSSSGEAIVGPAAAPKGTGRQTSVIEDGAAQAALQPWIGMECYQLSVGSRLAQMDSLDLWLASAATAARSGVVLDADMMGDMILQTALQLVTHEGQDDTPPPPAARARAVRICRLARDYLQSRFEAHLVPTIVEVCRAVGVSERSVQYAFQTCVGMSPLRCIRRCRLNRVRSTLLMSDAAGTTVTRIAMQFGFLHLGRFAGEYKQTFQEVPTATLARSV